MESKWLPFGLPVKLCFNMKVLSFKTMHFHILLNCQIVLTKKPEFELTLFNSAKSVRIFGIINDVCHL